MELHIWGAYMYFMSDHLDKAFDYILYVDQIADDEFRSTILLHGRIAIYLVKKTNHKRDHPLVQLICKAIRKSFGIILLVSNPSTWVGKRAWRLYRWYERF